MSSPLSTHVLPELPHGLTARVPAETDVEAVIELLTRQRQHVQGSAGFDPEIIRRTLIGPGSWSRRQLIVAREDGALLAWLAVTDRAAGRANLEITLAPEDAWQGIDTADLRRPIGRWALQAAEDIMITRHLDETQLDADPDSRDERLRLLLSDSAFVHLRTWLHMTRPVTADEQGPEPRPGVLVRPVRTHGPGQPHADDLQLVHRLLEESFVDHFNSYRESFPEFVARLREDPGHRWAHWWIAFITEDPEADAHVEDATLVPAGALVGSASPADATGAEGTYIEYIGVHRNARGRGVAKALLHHVIADTRDRGRNRVGLEVDADSPTGAADLYRSMGWESDFETESWMRTVQRVSEKG